MAFKTADALLASEYAAEEQDLQRQQQDFLEAQAKLHDPDLELDKKWHAISKEAHSRIRPEYLPFLKEGPAGVTLGFKLSQTRSLRDKEVLSDQARELLGV